MVVQWTTNRLRISYHFLLLLCFSAGQNGSAEWGKSPCLLINSRWKQKRWKGMYHLQSRQLKPEIPYPIRARSGEVKYALSSRKVCLDGWWSTPLNWRSRHVASHSCLQMHLLSRNGRAFKSASHTAWQPEISVILLCDYLIGSKEETGYRNLCRISVLRRVMQIQQHQRDVFMMVMFT